MISEANLLLAIRKSPSLSPLLDLPRRVAELEERVAVLQALLSLPRAVDAQPCPECQGDVRVQVERRYNGIENAMLLQLLVCNACGKRMTRQCEVGEA